MENKKSVAGNITAPSKERYVDDLTKYTKPQLEDIRNREEKLLSNKKRLERLPDKGQRIKDFYQKLIKEIENRNEIDRAAELFSNLNIATKGIAAMTSLEWNGKLNSPENEQILLDSDDDNEEMDPLKIIAQSRDSKKTVKITKPEPSLVTKEDLEEIKSFQSNYRPQPAESNNSSTCELDPHTIYVCEMDHHGGKLKTKFMPFKTTKTDVHSIEKEKLRKVGPHWEITAATPPPLRNTQAKVLSLLESIELQAQQNKNLKEIEGKHAQERLAFRTELAKSALTSTAATQSFGKDMNSFFTSYRELVDVDSSDDDQDDLESYDSDDECHDEEPAQGGVSISNH